MFIRSLIVLSWVSLIFAILYFPNWQITSPTAKSLNIFAWGDILEPSVIADFEKETGIKVNLNYYSSNEELLVKMRATQGFGYDLIIPSDYAVKALEEEGLLKELDKGQLLFWNQLNPLLLNHPFDPGNHYSIPFGWEIFGLGIDKGYFQTHPLMLSWDMIFRPQGFKIAMLNDPIEVMALAAFYLFPEAKNISHDQAREMKNLLMHQKKWVEAYASFRGDYFIATKNCPVVVSTSSYLRRSMKQFPFVGFVVPKEGTFITIENLCIPKLSTKTHNVYQFINYLFRQESIQTHYDTYGFFPTSLAGLNFIEHDPETRRMITSSPGTFNTYHFIENILPEQLMHDMWVEIKTQSLPYTISSRFLPLPNVPACVPVPVPDSPLSSFRSRPKK
jgi:spermidine/putrescine transport system substrate-binding protein